jgi:hypothetical protein
MAQQPWFVAVVSVCWFWTPPNLIKELWTGPHAVTMLKTDPLCIYIWVVEGMAS